MKKHDGKFAAFGFLIFIFVSVVTISKQKEARARFIRSEHVDAIPSPTPSPTPSPAAKKNPKAALKSDAPEGVANMTGIRWNVSLGKGLPKVPQCIGVSFTNEGLSATQVNALLADPWLQGQGRVLCMLQQPVCAKPCVPVAVNGKTL